MIVNKACLNFHFNTQGIRPTLEQYNEFKYLWYVGCSRAEYQLKIYVDKEKFVWPLLKDIPKDIYIVEYGKKDAKKLRNSLKRQPSKLKLKQGYDPKNWEKTLNNAFLAMNEDFSSYRPEELSLQEWITFSAQIEYQQRIL